jgi:FkbM family methyltransferase
MIRRIVYTIYFAFRSVLRATGLIRPFRALLGPHVGRLVFGMSRKSSEPVDIMGHKMYLASSGRFPPMAMAMGQYEQKTTELFESLVEPGMVVVDIGGHVGYYSMLAAQKTGPTGRVYTFEPDPDNFELLSKNAAINGYDNITLINKAVSKSAGTATLHVSALDNGRHSIFNHQIPQSGSFEVETISLDAFLKDQGSPNVGLIKIDVEGAEEDALNGMDQLLRETGKINMIIEFNPVLLQDAGVNLQEFLEMPSKWGFIVEVIDDEQGSIPLPEADFPELTSRLLASDGSVNLFCKKA